MNAVDNIVKERAKSNIVRVEGRSLVKVCPKCGNEFQTWHANRRHCSQKCGLLRTVDERFWEKVDKRGPDECWPWLAKAKNHGDYGILRVAGRNYVATHISWMIAHGRRVPKGKIVRHKCDNPKCVNPAHLQLGTARQNMQDCIDRGRFRPRGCRNPEERLRRDQIIAVALLYRERTFGYHRISKVLKVSPYEIRNTIRQKTWEKYWEWNQIAATPALLILPAHINT
jgi:ribosomal protein S27AE